MIKRRERFMMFMEKRESRKTNREKIKDLVVDTKISILIVSLVVVEASMEEVEVKEVIIILGATSSNKFTRTYLKIQM